MLSPACSGISNDSDLQQQLYSLLYIYIYKSAVGTSGSMEHVVIMSEKKIATFREERFNFASLVPASCHMHFKVSINIIPCNN